MRQIILVLHNVRSTHNVGSLLRTADGLAINSVIFSGYTPYPESKHDSRLPHIAAKLTNQIHKTALGAEKSVHWETTTNLAASLINLKKSGFTIAALEQTASAVDVSSYSPPDKIVIIVGNEITGIDSGLLDKAMVHLQIPMLGVKESFNVSVAGAIALYHLRYMA